MVYALIIEPIGGPLFALFQEMYASVEQGSTLADALTLLERKPTLDAIVVDFAVALSEGSPVPEWEQMSHYAKKPGRAIVIVHPEIHPAFDTLVKSGDMSWIQKQEGYAANTLTGVNDHLGG
ncbi:MAG: hypothetical protein Q7S65_04900 [Nanoarchaeota archaeon]|nr:hypothetical protein [Nanoarchaeota archaeon]